MERESIDEVVEGAMRELVAILDRTDAPTQRVLLMLMRTLNQLRGDTVESVRAQIRACRIIGAMADILIKHWNLNAPPRARIDPTTLEKAHEGTTDEPNVH